MAPTRETNEAVRKMLRSKQLTQGEFAQLADVSEKTVGRWARDEVNAPAKAIRRAAEKLGVDPAQYGIAVYPVASSGDDEPPAWATEMNAKLDTLIEMMEGISR